MFSLLRFLVAPIAVLALASAPTFAAESFSTSAPVALLMDADSHTVLFEKAADDLISPASTVKIMTAELVFREIKEGRINLDTKFTVSEHAWRTGGAGAGGWPCAVIARCEASTQSGPFASHSRVSTRAWPAWG